MNNHPFLGIDPGKSGGYVILLRKLVFYHPFSDNPKDNYNFLKKMKFEMYSDTNEFIGIEKVSSMPGQGVRSMFSFGNNLGFTQGLLCALGLPFQEIRPQIWQKYFVPPTKVKFDKNTAKAIRKEKLLEKAKSLYPTSNLWKEYKYVQNACTDALLIAHYMKENFNADS